MKSRNWKLESEVTPDGSDLLIVDGDRLRTTRSAVIADCRSPARVGTEEEAFQDARLMRAAPKLYEALDALWSAMPPLDKLQRMLGLEEREMVLISRQVEDALKQVRLQTEPVPAEPAPFVAVADHELGAEILDGDLVTGGCKHPGHEHEVESSKPPLLQTITCGKTTYIVGLNNKALSYVRKVPK